MGVVGMLLPITNSELTLGNTRLIGHNQHRVVGDCVPRSSNPHKEQLIAKCSCLLVIADVEVANLEILLNLDPIPSLLGYWLDRIADELPNQHKRIPDDDEDTRQHHPRQRDGIVQNVPQSVVAGFLFPSVEGTHHHPSDENREYDF